MGLDASHCEPWNIDSNVILSFLHRFNPSRGRGTAGRAHIIIVHNDLSCIVDFAIRHSQLDERIGLRFVLGDGLVNDRARTVNRVGIARTAPPVDRHYITWNSEARKHAISDRRTLTRDTAKLELVHGDPVTPGNDIPRRDRGLRHPDSMCTLDMRGHVRR